MKKDFGVKTCLPSPRRPACSRVQGWTWYNMNMKTVGKARSLAVLIDADNVSSALVEPIFRRQSLRVRPTGVSWCWR